MRRQRAAAVLLVGALGCLGALAGCGDQESPAGPSDATTSAGAATAGLVPVEQGTIEGDSSFVQLPGGRVELTVSAPVQEVSAQDAVDGRAHTAPAGRVLVGVGFALTPGEGLPAWAYSLMQEDPRDIGLALTSGGTTYDLGLARPGADGAAVAPGAVYVPVTGTGEKVMVAVTYDGHPQRVDARTGIQYPGIASGLYDLVDQPEPPAAQDCSDGAWVETGSAEVGCTFWSARLPYVAGLGWSGGDQWTVVDIGTVSDSVRVDGSSYDLEDLVDASTLDARPAAATLLPTTGAGGALNAYAVFDGTGSTLGIVREATGRLDSGVAGAPAEVPVTLANTVPLG